MTSKPNPSFDFVLPYDFIEIEPTKPSYSYKKRGPLSGEIVVRIETKTPLVAIKATEKNENVKVIPGSSIRGMLRNAAEIIWDEAINYNLPKRRHKDAYKQKEAEMLDEHIPRHIRIDGNENLVDGSVIRVKVIAQSGDIREYKINITATEVREEIEVFEEDDGYDDVYDILEDLRKMVIIIIYCC